MDSIIIIIIIIILLLIFGLIIGCLLYFKKNQPIIIKKYLNEINHLSEKDFNSILFLLRELYIKNINEKLQNIVYFVIPSMIEVLDNGLFSLKTLNNEQEYVDDLEKIRQSNDNILYIDPRLYLNENIDSIINFKHKEANLYLAYSIGILFLKYCINISNDEIKNIFKENHEFKFDNNEINEFVKNSLNITKINAIKYINSIDDLTLYLKNNKLDSKYVKIAKVGNNELNNSLSSEEKDNKIIYLNNNEEKNNYIIDLNNSEEKKNNYIIDDVETNNLPKKKDKKEVSNVIIPIQAESINNCPHCKTIYFFENGCNFITCSSVFCKSQKFFCHLCGDKLKNSQKNSHYPNGIYGDSCFKRPLINK